MAKISQELNNRRGWFERFFCFCFIYKNYKIPKKSNDLRLNAYTGCFQDGSMYDGYTILGLQIAQHAFAISWPQFLGLF